MNIVQTLRLLHYSLSPSHLVGSLTLIPNSIDYYYMIVILDILLFNARRGARWLFVCAVPW